MVVVSSTVVLSSTWRYKHVVFSDVDGTLVHYPTSISSSSATTTTTTPPPPPSNDESFHYLPPSKTGTRGVLSTHTLTLCHRLRHGEYSSSSSSSSSILARRVPLVLISGMRTTTLFQRLPYLPRADAYVSESGGRIFYPRTIISASITDKEETNKADEAEEEEEDHSSIVHPISYPNMPPGYDIPFSLVEDMDWRDRMSQDDSAGPDGYYDLLPKTNIISSHSYTNNNVVIDNTTTTLVTAASTRRRGRLWECAQSLIDQGYIIDTEGYATSFRINRKQQTNIDILQNFDNFIADCNHDSNHHHHHHHHHRTIISNELGCSTNLGCVDVYPAMSGKRNCAEYLMHKFLRTRCNSIDDHDDIDIVGGEGQETRSETTDSSSQLPPPPPATAVSLKTHAYFLCDDDNDIELAMACIAAYLPSVTSESIRSLATMKNSSLIIMENVSKGIVESFATEAALDAIIEIVESS